MAEEPARVAAGGVEEPEPEPDPEAMGFGNQPRRVRRELVWLLLVVVALPFGFVWGARRLAEGAAMRLPPSLDARLGRPTWEALRVSSQSCDDPAAQRYVESIAAPLLAALGETPFEFRFMVVESESVNAFALPGGYVVVNSALLESAETGEEVAAVLAHELSHVTLRHSTKRLAGSLGARAALALVLGVVDIGAPAYSLAHLADLGFERDQERQADERGRALLRSAGISPAGMATFFERLTTGPRPPELLSTHPDPGARAESARSDAAGFVASRSLPAPAGVACGAQAK